MGVLEERGDAGQGRREGQPPFALVDSAAGEPATYQATAADSVSEGDQESDEVEIPLVMPGHREPSFWRRHSRQISRVALIASVLSMAWVLYDRLATGRTEPAPAFSSVADRAVTPELRSIAEEFETAVSRYGERMEDFDLGRLGCEGLWTGYRRVDEMFMSLSERYAAARGEAADRLYEDSKRSMEEIERHFDGSGCPRNG